MNVNLHARSRYFRSRSVWRAAVATILFAFVGLGVAGAQQLSPNQVQQVLGQPDVANRLGGQTNPTQGAGGPGAPAVIIEPSAPLGQALPQSALERILSARAGTPLSQFGYADVGVGSAILLPQMGGMQDSYILGPGDEIVISLRGQENSESRWTVDRSGRVTMSKLAPINAAGRTLGDFASELKAAVKRSYIATDAYVSLGAIRQIRVTVAGEVNTTGVRVMNGLSSPLDALNVSNGVKKSGSLRNIQLVRNGGRTRIDLYGILRGTGTTQLPLLTDGDQIIVPPLGQTVAIAGPVRAPGIYELSPGQSSMSANSLISLAGGFIVRGRYNFSLIELLPDGRTSMGNLPDDKGLVRDSDILIVQPTADLTVGRVTILGSNGFNGSYSLRTSHLSDLLKTPGFMGEDPYVLFGIISRRDPTTFLRKLIAFTPSVILSGRQDFDLQSDDIVRVFSRAEFHQMVSTVTSFDDLKRKQDEAISAPETAAIEAQDKQAAQDQANAANQSAALTQQILALGANNAAGGQRSTIPALGLAVPSISSQGSSTEGAVAQSARENAPQTGEEQRATAAGVSQASEALAQSLKVDSVILVSFVHDHVVSLSGAVNGPGNYLIGPGVDLKTLVDAAGGTVGWADNSGVEVISTTVDNVTGQSRTLRQNLDLSQANMGSRIVLPRDQYQFQQAITTLVAGTVTLQGEVRHPGVYPILRGERLSELLVRAGGLTEVAYPQGSVFLRKSAAQKERQGFQQEARALESQLMESVVRGGGSSSGSSGDSSTSDSVLAAQSLINDLRRQPGLGRVSIIADPAVLVTQPELDPLLEQGDVLYIPQRPSTVTVLGEVMNSTSFPAQSNMSVSDYIDRAGGFSPFADKSLIFVVLPDGSARQVDSSWLSVGEAPLPPGSSIVVPRDISPVFNVTQFVLQGTQVLGQLAIAAASLAVLKQTSTK